MCVSRPRFSARRHVHHDTYIYTSKLVATTATTAAVAADAVGAAPAATLPTSVLLEEQILLHYFTY